MTTARFASTFSPDVENTLAFFHNYAYLRNTARRLEHLATLGLDLTNRSVLELGAGVGDHTLFYLDRGCRVCALEAREDNCNALRAVLKHLVGLARARFAPEADIKLSCCDIERIDACAPANGPFEIVHCYGLLYHIGDPEKALQAMAQRCSDILLLETQVSLSHEERLDLNQEEAVDITQSFHGPACYPSRLWLFNRLKALFPHVYLPRTQPAHDEFPLDWTSSAPKATAARSIFVASRRALNNPTLLDHLPTRQTLV